MINTIIKTTILFILSLFIFNLGYTYNKYNLKDNEKVELKNYVKEVLDMNKESKINNEKIENKNKQIQIQQDKNKNKNKKITKVRDQDFFCTIKFLEIKAKKLKIKCKTSTLKDINTKNIILNKEKYFGGLFYKDNYIKKNKDKLLGTLLFLEVKWLNKYNFQVKNAHFEFYNFDV